MEKSKLNLTDFLAVERTRLANERTFLAYFRTFIVILSSGLAIIKLDILSEIKTLGYFFLFISPFLLLIGIFRLLYVKRRIKKVYHLKD